MARMLIFAAGASVVVIGIAVAAMDVFSGDGGGLLRPDDADVVAQS